MLLLRCKLLRSTQQPEQYTTVYNECEIGEAAHCPNGLYPNFTCTPMTPFGFDMTRKTPLLSPIS